MKHINLRLPDDLHERLKELAEQDRRSINNQLVVLIEQELDRRNTGDSKHAEK